MDHDMHLRIAEHHTRPFKSLKSELAKIAGQIVKARQQIVNSMLESWP